MNNQKSAYLIAAGSFRQGHEICSGALAYTDSPTSRVQLPAKRGRGICRLPQPQPQPYFGGHGMSVAIHFVP
jgi:hypothetical protein